MRRWILIVLAAVAVGLLVAVAITPESVTTRGPAVERTCHHGDDFASVVTIKVGDTDVSLSCGDRLVVTGQQCEIQRGSVFTPVACTGEQE